MVNNGSEEMITSSLKKLGGDHLLDEPLVDPGFRVGAVDLGLGQSTTFILSK